MQKLISRLLILILIFPFILNAQWVQTNLNPGIGYSLFSNDTTIYAGTNSGVYYTNDIGDPWFSIGPDDWIYSLIKAGNNLVAGSGSAKGIWISSDLGANWSNASGMENQSVYALCKNDNYIFAGTWGSGVFRSGDKGSTWQKVGLEGEPVQAVFSLADTIFAGGEDLIGGKIYFSTNNGESWDFRYLPYPALSVNCFVQKAGKVFAGTDAGLYSSSDVGNSWSLESGVTFDSSGTVTDAKMIKALVAHDQYMIAAFTFEGIWISSDNGKEWTSYNDGLISDWSFNGLAVKDPNLWSLREGFGNAYMRPLTDLITDIQSEVELIPGDHKLYQNYPNPFNPSTTIGFSLLKSSFVTLEVYNSLGQKVATLLNKNMNSGNFNVKFDASSINRRISSGIYYYMIHAGEFQAVKKMLLLQ